MQKRFDDLFRSTKLLILFMLSLLILTGCESKKTIVNGLDEKEANEIYVFLSTKGIIAIKIQNAGGSGGASKTITYDIAVTSDKVTEAMSLLNQVGLPRRKPQNLLDIFSSSNLVPSDLQEQIKYQAGLASQIASTIRKIDGVLDAEVQISFPKDDPLNPLAKKDKITASVYVKYAGMLEDPNVHLTSRIKRLVAASVTGLDYDNVTVILDRARFNEPTSGGGGIISGEDKSFVTIWSVVVAHESVTRFRVIFFAFSILMLLLILSLIWYTWKFYPVLKSHGGWKELLRLHPIHAEKKEEPEEEKKEKVEEKKEEPGDRDFDET